MLISVEMMRTATRQVAAGYNYPAETRNFNWHGYIWLSKKQSTGARSTTEAETVALSYV